MKFISGVVLGCVALMTVVQAASFDCGKSSSALEKAICADPEISLLDETLAKNYSDAMKLLSAEGKIILRDGQRRWLHHVANVCLVYKNDRGTPECTKQMYKYRIKDMGTAATQVGPFVFSRIDYFFSKSDDEFGRPYQGQTSYPRIDSPLSDAAIEWNALMAPNQKAQGEGWCDGRPGDVNFSFLIKSATETTISSQSSNWTYCHGAPHGLGGAKGMTYVLVPEPHLLAASDLFDSDESWEEFLTEKSISELEHTVAKRNVAKVDLGKCRISPRDEGVVR